jgi:maltose-binding protein MalE
MKKVFSVLIIVVLMLCLSGCETSNKIQKPTLAEESNENISIWTDTETGVQYIVYTDTAGYCGMGGITPRLNADGTLYVVETEKGSE